MSSYLTSRLLFFGSFSLSLSLTNALSLSLCCCCLPCYHCSNWTWAVGETLAFCNMLRSTHCRKLLYITLSIYLYFSIFLTHTQKYYLSVYLPCLFDYLFLFLLLLPVPAVQAALVRVTRGRLQDKGMLHVLNMTHLVHQKLKVNFIWYTIMPFETWFLIKDYPLITCATYFGQFWSL